MMTDKTPSVYSSDYIDDLHADLQQQIDDIASKSGSTNLNIDLGSTISKNGIVTLIKGDTFHIVMDLNVGTPLQPLKFIMEDGDYVQFRLFRANNDWSNAVLIKQVTKDDLDNHGNAVFTFESEDTENLSCGTYYYQVKLFYTRENNLRVITLMPRTKFHLMN